MQKGFLVDSLRERILNIDHIILRVSAEKQAHRMLHGHWFSTLSMSFDGDVIQAHAICQQRCNDNYHVATEPTH